MLYDDVVFTTNINRVVIYIYIYIYISDVFLFGDGA